MGLSHSPVAFLPRKLGPFPFRFLPAYRVGPFPNMWKSCAAGHGRETTRRQNPTTVPNLIRLFLSAAERQWHHERRSVNLASARLRAHRCASRLSGAQLASADLSGADFIDARLDAANLTNADLSHTLLNRTDFAGAKLVGTRLEGPTSLSLATSLRIRIIRLGDAFTFVPHHLEPPLSWTEASDTEQQLDDGRSAPVPNVTARGRGGTMSGWSGAGPSRRQCRKSNRNGGAPQDVARLAHDVLLDLLLRQPRRGAKREDGDRQYLASVIVLVSELDIVLPRSYLARTVLQWSWP